MVAGIAVAALLGLVTAAAGYPEGNEMAEPRERRSTELPRPRDPALSGRSELEAARRAGTVEAYDRFLARHFNHPLARAARRERAAIAARQRK